MNRVTITLTIDLPDGVVPDVAYGSVPEPADLFQAFGSAEPETPRLAVAEQIRPQVPGQSAPLCSTHGVAMARWPAGTNKQGKPYNASWRCPVKDCPTKPLWDRDAA